MTKTQIRDFVVSRAKSRCEYCLSPLEFSSDDFAVEHIVPKSLLGSDDVDNLALSCQGCNNRKFVAISAIDPTTGLETRLYHPRLDVWLDHFIWSDEATELIGLTAVARATITRLELNRSRVQNLRRVLVMAGKHP
jgi:HNH endonuclease